MTPPATPDSSPFTLTFCPGLPPAGADAGLFVLDDGSVHAGDLVWAASVLAPSGRRRVLRTTNPAGGVHLVFDIPAARIIGYASAGPRWRRRPVDAEAIDAGTDVAEANAKQT